MTVNPDIPQDDALKQFGAIYYPYRSGLLTDPDRRALQEDKGEQLKTRALSEVFGFGGMSTGKLLTADPFLLFPARSNPPTPATS